MLILSFRIARFPDSTNNTLTSEIYACKILLDSYINLNCLDSLWKITSSTRKKNDTGDSAANQEYFSYRRFFVVVNIHLLRWAFDPDKNIIWWLIYLIPTIDYYPAIRKESLVDTLTAYSWVKWSPKSNRNLVIFNKSQCEWVSQQIPTVPTQYSKTDMT